MESLEILLEMNVIFIFLFFCFPKFKRSFLPLVKNELVTKLHFCHNSQMHILLDHNLCVDKPLTQVLVICSIWVSEFAVILITA